MLIVAVVVSYVDGREVWRNGSTHETDVVRLYAETAVQCRSRGAEASSGIVVRCAHQQSLRCLIGIVVRKDRYGQDMREGGREGMLLYNGRLLEGKLQVASSLIFRRVARPSHMSRGTFRELIQLGIGSSKHRHRRTTRAAVREEVAMH